MADKIENRDIVFPVDPSLNLFDRKIATRQAAYQVRYPFGATTVEPNRGCTFKQAKEFGLELNGFAPGGYYADNQLVPTDYLKIAQQVTLTPNVFTLQTGKMNVILHTQISCPNDYNWTIRGINLSNEGKTVFESLLPHSGTGPGVVDLFSIILYRKETHEFYIGDAVLTVIVE